MPWYIQQHRQWHGWRGRSGDPRRPKVLQTEVTQDYPRRSSLFKRRRLDREEQDRIRRRFEEEQFVIANEFGDSSISLPRSFFMDP